MARTRKPKVVTGQDIPTQEAPQLTNVVDRIPEVRPPPHVQPRASQGPSVGDPPKGPVMLIEPDPLHGTLSPVFLVAARRILSFAQSYPNEMQPEPFVRTVLTRLCFRDPTLKVIVAMDTGSGEAVGHLVATIERNETDRWAFCWQAETNAGPPGLLQQMIDYATPWAKAQGATHVLMATQIDPRFWEDKYGFETVRHVMKRAL